MAFIAGCSGDGDGDGGSGGDGGDGGSGGDGGDGSDDGGDGGDGGGQQITDITLASGAEGSSPFGAGQALQALANDVSDQVRITAQSSAGTTGNLRLLSSGQVDAGITTNFTFVRAINEEGSFAEEPIDNPPLAGFTGGYSQAYLMARDGSGVETWSDMEGKNVWPYWPAAGFRPMFELFLQDEFGIWDSMNVLNMQPSELPGAIAEGRVDVFGVFSNSDSPQVIGYNQELNARSNLEFHPVEMDQEYRDQVMQMEVPDAEEKEIYGWEGRDFNGDPTVMINANTTVSFHSDVSEDIAYHVTQMAHENGQRLFEDSVHFANISNEETLTHSNIPSLAIHPGVANYYEEIGVWNDDWQRGW